MKKRWGFVLLVEIVILLLALFYSVNHFQKNKTVLNYRQDEFQCLAGETDNGFYVDTSQNNFKDIRIGLSGIEIPSGSYLLDVEYRSKGIAHLAVYYAHERNEYDLIGNVTLSDVETRKKLNITVDEGQGPFFITGRLNSECVEGDYLLFTQIAISRTFTSYRLFIFRLFLCMLLADGFLYLFSKNA